MIIRLPSLRTSGTFLTAVLIFAGVIAAQAPPPALATLYSFAGYPGDGANPYGSVAIGKGGVLYGTTYSGGLYWWVLARCSP